MHKKQALKGLPALDRAVKPNPKFSHIQSTLNTGCNVNKVKTITSREYAKRRDEIFYRITKKQLVELIAGYDEEGQESISNFDSPGKAPRIVSYSEHDGASDDKPYLIIDTRDPQAFNQCCIRHAKSFPLTMMKRDQMLPELYAHRNREEHLVIVYCDDERISAETAKFLVDRGTNNTFLLTGGMMELVGEYPEFVDGEIPYPPSPQKMAALRREKQQAQRGGSGRRLHGIGEDDEDLMQSPGRSNYSNNGSRQPPVSSNSRHGNSSGLTASQLRQHDMMTGGIGGSRGGMSSGTSSRAGGGGYATGRSEAGYSMASTKSVAESIISRATARKGKF